MRILRLPFLLVLLLSGCSSPERKPPQSVTLQEGQFQVTSNWQFRSRIPIESFYSQMFACWLDEKKMEVRSGGRRNHFQETTRTVRQQGTNVAIPLRVTDYNRGRVCFTEVVFFLLEDGSVEQRTFVSNVLESPRKELHFFPK